MSLSLGVFVFINAWCLTLFMVVPFFTTSEEKEGSNYVAAPKALKWRRVIVANSLVALVATLAVMGVIESGLLPMRDAN
jgi:predicted secreted protein